MTIEQTVEILPGCRLFVDIPPEVPKGKAILTLTTVSTNNEQAQEIRPDNLDGPEELREKLQNLQGSLGKNAFGALDGVAYQRKVREEWGD